MTEEEKTKNIINELLNGSYNEIEDLANWHLSELKKAELRARIEELETLGGDVEENNADHDLQIIYQERDDRIHEYQSELRKQEEDNE